MSPQFVTAIYTGLEGTRFNGNSGAIYDRYQKSLLSIAKGGYSIVCYTSQAHMEALTKVYAEYPNVRLVEFELADSPFHDSIEKIKDLDSKYTTEGSWRSRCVEIMWGKFLWMQENLESLNADDSIFWIDAGIFHGGLIAGKYRSNKSANEFDFDEITQKRNLFDDLVSYSGDKLLNIRSTWVNHGKDDFEEIFRHSPEYGVIGGIIGGKKKLLESYLEDMIQIMLDVLAANKLLKEEEIMYHINCSSPEKFTDFIFNSWYHEDWAEIYNKDRGDISVSDFFGVIRGN